MYLTSAWHAWSPPLPLTLKLQQLERLDGQTPRRQQTLMIRFAIFRWRRWRVFRSARSTAQVDSYQSFFHSLAFLDAVGTYIILLRIFHQLIRDDAQVVLHHSSTRLVVTPWPIGFCWVFSRPRETASVLLFTTLGDFAWRAGSDPMLFKPEISLLWNITRCVSALWPLAPRPSCPPTNTNPPQWLVTQSTYHTWQKTWTNRRPLSMLVCHFNPEWFGVSEIHRPPLGTDLFSPRSELLLGSIEEPYHFQQLRTIRTKPRQACSLSRYLTFERQHRTSWLVRVATHDDCFQEIIEMSRLDDDSDQKTRQESKRLPYWIKTTTTCLWPYFVYHWRRNGCCCPTTYVQYLLTINETTLSFSSVSLVYIEICTITLWRFVTSHDVVAEINWRIILRKQIHDIRKYKTISFTSIAIVSNISISNLFFDHLAVQWIILFIDRHWT